MRFVSLQCFQVVLRCRGRPSLATIPLRPWIFLRHRRGSGSGRRCGPCGFSPSVHRARHAPQDPRFTPVRSGHSPRSLFSRDVPYPVGRTLTRPGRTYLAFGPATLMGFLTLRSFPCPRVPAFLKLNRQCLIGRLRIHFSAVHPDMPLAGRLAPLLFTVVGRRF